MRLFTPSLSVIQHIWPSTKHVCVLQMSQWAPGLCVFNAPMFLIRYKRQKWRNWSFDGSSPWEGRKDPPGIWSCTLHTYFHWPQGHYIIVIIALLSILIFLVTIWGGYAGVTRREGCLCQIVNPSYSRSYQGLTILSDTLACLESTVEIINSISQWVTQRNMLQNAVIWFLTRYCMLFINTV